MNLAKVGCGKKRFLFIGLEDNRGMIIQGNESKVKGRTWERKKIKGSTEAEKNGLNFPSCF